MAIPRNIKGVNPAKVKKNGAYMSEHQNVFLQSNEELSLPGSDDEVEELPDLDEVFQNDDPHPEKAHIFDEVKNLDESELDKLLGIDDFDDGEDETDIIEFEDDVPDEKGDVLVLNDGDDNSEQEVDDADDELPELEMDGSLPFVDDLVIDELSEETDYLDEDDDSTIVATDENSDDNDDVDILFEDEENTDDENSEDDSDDFEFTFGFDELEPEDENAGETEDDSEIESIVFEDELGDSDDEVDVISVDEDEDDDEESFVFFDGDNEDHDDNGISDDDETFVFEEIDDEDSDDDNDDAFANIEEDEYIPDESEILPVQSLSKKKRKTDNTDDDTEKENTDSDDTQTPSKDKDKHSFFNNLIDKLKLMKSQIAADLKGDEVPTSLPDEDEDNSEQENDDEDKDEKEPKKRGRKGGASRAGNPFKKLFGLKIFSPFIKLYKMIVNLCFGVLNAVLGILSKIPFIGKFLKPVLAASQALQKIATFMPIVLVLLILVLINVFSVPRSYESQDLPDGAALTISDFSYDGETASATVTNTGEIILDTMDIEFEIYSMQPSVNPKTWIIPQPVSKCAAQVDPIDIEGEAEISVSCAYDKGKMPRATAHLKE